VDVDHLASSATLVGHVSPSTGTLVVERPSGEGREAPLDEVGGFELAGIEPGAVRLVVLTDGGQIAVRTDWFTL
jgi:hypothetical protein